MTESELAPAPTRRRADVERNERTILDAASRVFATSGVDATVREVATAAGVGMGTLYRHFPTRADLMVAVYRHQIEECAEAGPALLASSATPFVALQQWVDKFVDFLGTKHGLGKVWAGDAAGFSALHQLILDRLLPALAELLEAARAAGEVVADLRPYELLRAVGDLVAYNVHDPDYDVRRIIDLLLAGLRQPASGRAAGSEAQLGTPRPLAGS